MNRKTWMVIVMAAVAAVTVIGMSIAAGAAARGKFGWNNQAPVQQFQKYQTTAVVGTLTEQEKASLLYMVEEEKLAHDVYVALAEAWGAPIFAQIATSEQRHSESIAFLLEKYGLKDPTADSKPGVFVNKELQALYTKLVADGKVSLVAAYKVGMTVEDLDIKDLEEDLKATKNADVIRVYENLLAGSMNHLNAFYVQLKNLGGEYAAQYITAEHFKEIIDGGYGQARMMQGRGMMGGMMQGWGARPMQQYRNNFMNQQNCPCVVK
ncbi:MAG TPA: DUF2202 domain-containing protein [Bacillota bacterium]|nr:DUF2202 domain-containing protein [Bacillota bacterium]HOA15219.1 DUF2202 domain-containing protein [Bacillota bacterium]HOG52612.1 DUF2202 domain-containing protein [Bacillota bacterium]